MRGASKSARLASTKLKSCSCQSELQRIRTRRWNFGLRPSHFCGLPSFRLAKRHGAHCKSGHGAFDLVGGSNVAKLVAPVPSQFFQTVKFANVNTLFDQQILVYRIKTAATRWGRTHFKA